MPAATMVTDHPPSRQTEELLHRQDHPMDRRRRRVRLMGKGLRRQPNHLIMDLLLRHASQLQTCHLKNPLPWEKVVPRAAAGDIAEAEVVHEAAEAAVEEDDNDPGSF